MSCTTRIPQLARLIHTGPRVIIIFTPANNVISARVFRASPLRTVFLPRNPLHISHFLTNSHPYPAPAAALGGCVREGLDLLVVTPDE